jgi:N4-gp56 family major capsid protein
VSSTEGVAAIAEGTNPASVTWGATSYNSGPAQYGILVAVSDLLVRNSAIEVIDSASRQVRNALARLVDTLLQTVVNGGTNGVIYSGGKTSRTALGASDTITKAEIIKATKYLRSSNAAGARPFSVNTPDSNNPLNLYTSISGKVTLGATRFEDLPGYIRIARVESAISN